MSRNWFPGSRRPVLDPLETIECRDAILTPDGGEPEWPEADVAIGNPVSRTRQYATHSITLISKDSEEDAVTLDHDRPRV